MKFLKNIIISLVGLSLLNFTQALEFVDGTRQEFGMDFTDEQRIALPVISKAIQVAGLGNKLGMSVSFLNMAETNDWYRLYEGPYIVGVDISQFKLLGSWPIARWAHLNRPELVMQGLMKAKPRTTWHDHIEYTSHRPFSGCLNKTPLRYGDIEEDGEKELILLLNGEFIIFSPLNGRTVFSNFYQADDWFRDPNWKKEPLVSEVDGKFYQYQSEHMILNGISTPAYRYYSKLFVGDFDEDGNPDIVLWAKTYVSNEKDGNEGFTLLRSELKHYERDLMAQKMTEAGVTGEYLPQITTDVVIESWMRAENLTWSNGFPSKSECAGEEGKLIPEMHDPLLNDPDVLL
ncbi:MAG: hypothetical protein KBT79_05385 [Thalassolituus oleivorans]|nr:hypothetical protein [Thalassolituus oleivorans]